MRRVRHLSLAVPVLLLGAFGTAGPVLAAPCDGSSDSLGNGGFETPAVAPDSFTLFAASEVAPWQTTDGAGEIEIWGTGFLGVPAAAGNGFAELNANTAGTLYQDVVSTPGSTMSWTLEHRAREGVDVMQVLIGDANTADVNGSTGWAFTSADLSDDTSAWGTHTGDFVVPDGQTCTRLAFRAVSTGSGSPSVGNFLDAVAFTVTIPAEPEPGATPRPTPPPTDMSASTHDGGSGVPAIPAATLVVASLVGLAFALRRTRGAGTNGRG